VSLLLLRHAWAKEDYLHDDIKCGEECYFGGGAAAGFYCCLTFGMKTPQLSKNYDVQRYRMYVLEN